MYSGKGWGVNQIIKQAKARIWEDFFETRVEKAMRRKPEKKSLKNIKCR